MVTQDFAHLAQVMQLLRAKVKAGTLPEDDFNRMVDRVIWAIEQSPDGSPSFNQTEREEFNRRCRGRY